MKIYEQVKSYLTRCKFAYAYTKLAREYDQFKQKTVEELSLVDKRRLVDILDRQRMLDNEFIVFLFEQGDIEAIKVVQRQYTDLLCILRDLKLTIA